MDAQGRPALRVEVLGPLRLVVDGTVAEVPGPKRRAVLALLALAEGAAVTVDRLVEALWPSEQPESARQALHTHVSRLRAHLGPAAARLQTRHESYRLELDPGALDATRARSLLAAARVEAERDPGAALALLREARGLWRGPVLADLTDVEPIATAVEGLTRLHDEVTDALVSCAVRTGQADSVLGLASAAHAADPLREAAVLLLMRTLAAIGRAPDALRTAREYRHRLAEETGLDPAPALGELERDIAAGAAGPAPPRPTGPAQASTRLVGRESEVAALHRLLAAERLVTVLGPGGVGKTRVAAEVARRTGTATVLLLAPVTDPAGLPHALAAALNLSDVRGDVLAACVAVLGDRPRLLVIDNCEHLLDAARDTVDTVLSSCPEVTVLATSRVPLGLPAEYAFRLAPLPLPQPGSADRDLPQVPSVAVFLDRATRVRPRPPATSTDLRTVADIVRRLDGMPLAIELAAGRLSTFSLIDLRDRLDRSLDLLGGGRPTVDARHRTLRATVEWSYELLSEDERRLFRYLSVFVDGVDLDTAERVAAGLCPADDPGGVLARLVDASMIEVDFGDGPDGRPRYRMLETLRAFGIDRLTATGEDDDAAAGLLRWALDLTRWFADTVTTAREPEADTVLRRELANLRAAWRCARGRGALDEATALVVGLYDAIAYRDLVELRDWAEELAGDPGLGAHPRAAAVLGTAAEAVYHRGDYPRAEQLARAGLETARADDDLGRWHCLTSLSVALLARGAFTEVVDRSVEAAALGPRPRENLGIAALAVAYAGDPDKARELNDQGRVDVVAPTGLSWAAYVAGEIDSSAGHRERAEDEYVQAVELARRSGATFLVGVATVGLLTLRADAGRIPDALRGYREVVDYFARTGNWTHQWTTLRNLADLLRRLGDTETATVLVAAADRAPDAPAVGAAAPDPAETPAAASRAPGRTETLALARAAIERNLTRR